MFRPSSLLLLTLVLNVRLCSSAPIPARVGQSSVVAEEPGLEELAPVTEDHSHFIEEKESVQEKLIPVVAGEAAPSPEESPAEEGIPLTAKEPEPVLDQVSDDAGEAVSQESAQQKPLAAAPQESSEEETALVKTAFAPAVAVDSESPEQHYVEDPAPEAPILVIPLEASEDEAPDENIEEEAAPEEPLLVVRDDNTEVEEKPLLLTSQEEKSVILEKLETGEAGQGEPAAGETAPGESVPEEPAVIVPMEPSEQELDQEEQEETVPMILSETKEEEAPEEHAKEEEEEVAPVILEENAEVDPATDEEPLPSTSEEEESVAPFPIELEGQVEPAAEETAEQESAPEEPAVIVPMEPTERELDQEEQEETEPEKEAPEEYTEVEVSGVLAPIVPEKNAEQDMSIDEKPHPITPEEKQSVVLVHAELDTVEEGQDELAAEETAPEKPVEPTSDELALEDPVLVIQLEDLEEDAPEDNTEEEVVQSDPLPNEAAPEEDISPQENEAGDSDAEISVTSVTETPSESETTEKVLDPGEEVPVAPTEDHVATLEPVTAPVPAVTDAEAEIVPAPVEGGNGTSMKTHSEDFRAAVTLAEEEPVALVNRMAVLGAAFFTLMSFITIGFIWTTVSKKLR